MSLAADLLRGAIDSHIHAGPTYIPRSIDMIEAAREAEAAGLRAIVLKDHHIPTVVIAKLINQYHVGPGFRTFGSIALNNHLGGLNLKALEIALLMDVKTVWLPTVSALNHHVKHDQGGLKFPKGSKAEVVPDNYLTLLDGDDLRADVVAVLEMIAQYPDVVLATGHGSAHEVDAVIRKALSLGIRRIVATHPTYMVDAAVEQMEEWARLGVLIEFTAATCYSGSAFCSTPVTEVIRVMRTIGPENCIMSSDFGQKANPRPVEGLRLWIEELLENGMTPHEIELMLSVNPGRVILGDQ